MTNTQGSDTESTRDELSKIMLTWYAEVTGLTNVNFTPDMQIENLIAELESYLEQQIAEATRLIHGRHSIECDKCYDDLGLTKDNNKEK